MRPAPESNAAPALDSVESPTSDRRLRSALDRLYDVPFLETHPLAAGLTAAPGDAGSVGRALRRRLVQAIDALGGPSGAETGRLHQLLVQRYVEGMAPAAVWKRLGLSRTVYYEEQARVIAAVAAFLGHQPDGATQRVVAAVSPGPATSAGLATSFVGRDDDMAELTRLLSGSRLVTLTGPGGMGKTRLATELARRWSDERRSAVAVVPLAALTTADQVLPAIAQALGVPETPRTPLSQAIAASLAAGDTLLVLDNLEHLLDAAPRIAELLARAPRLRVLATSREPLALAGEQEYALGPLAPPPAGEPPRLDEALAYPAVRLFVDRATAVDAGFALRADDVVAVAEICRRLDGLPLAIELAAARVRTFPPRALLARLGRTLDLLAGGRDADPRHRALRATLDWSYQMLDPAERRLFRWLGPFAGGGRLAAIVDVLGSDEAVVWDGVESLRRRSLLGRSEDADGEPRFWLIETMRQYAAEQLEGEGETDAARTGHAEHYLTLAGRLLPARFFATQSIDVGPPDREVENWRTALAWFIDRDDAESAAQLAAMLTSYWWARGLNVEGRGWLSRVLAMRGTAGIEPIARADLLRGVGLLAFTQDDYAPARARWEEALALGRAIDDPLTITATLRGLASLAAMNGDPRDAPRLLEESLAVARRHGDPSLVRGVLNTLGNALMRVGDHAGARAACEACLLEERSNDDRVRMAQAGRVLAMACRALGDAAAARRHGDESLALWRREGNVHGLTGATVVLAWLALDRNDLPAASELIEEGLVVSQRAGHQRGVGRHLDAAARFAALFDRPEVAIRLLGAADAVLDAIASPRAPAEQADLERTLALIEASGAAVRQTARAEGRALAPGRAGELALDVLRSFGSRG